MKSNKPKIRFSNYDDAWEQRKLGEVVQKYEDLVKTPTEGYERLGIRSHAKGTFHSYVERGKELETARMSRVAANKFIVNITFAWEHAVAITDENDAEKLVSHRFPQYTFNSNMVPGFFRYLILEERFKYHLGLSSPGGAGRNRVLNLVDMLDYKITFPTQPGQKKIATYFDSFDSLITLHQRKLELIKEYKKTMLRKMFPATGRLVPEIRFEGFIDAWEQRKLGEVAKFSKGKGYSKNDLTEEGTPIILYGSLYTNYQTVINKVNTFTLDKVNSVYSLGNEVVVPSSGESAEDIARASAIVSKGIILGGDLNIIHSNSNIDPIFLALLISNGERKIELAKKAQGKSVVHLYNTDLEEVNLIYPAREEQARISDFFSSIDNLITLHQRKLEHLEDQKKYFLKKMFV